MNRILLFILLCISTLQSCTKQETISYQAQFKIDTELVDSFVSSNNADAHKLPTGIWYSIDDLGDGVYPTLPDTVTISYTVREIKDDGLDSVGYSASSTIVPLSKAISGLQQGLILFPTTSSGRIYIPSGLAFGTSGHYDTTNVLIHSNANLLYEIKLISVKGTRLASDIKAIDSYLQSNSKESLHDVSGIRYTIDTTAQTSPKTKPKEGDDITVTYTENLLATDTSKVYSKKIAWKNQVTGWRIMLPKYLTKGSTITMYVPSGYGYGSSIKGLIPANSNLKYVITY